MAKLIENLRTNFGARVSDNICQDRTVAVEVKTMSYVMLGGSYCDRLRDVLKAMGKNAIKITAAWGLEGYQAECGCHGPGGEGEGGQGRRGDPDVAG